MNTKKNSTFIIAAIGSILVILILVFGTIWMGRTAKKDTEEAVRSVSLLYLDELAGRREQVVEGNLNSRINDIQTAISLINEEDLDSPDHLQKYQAKMKQIYALEKFAFVDSNGLIYTSQGTQTNIDEYKFDYRNISKPEISILNLKTADKKVIIAIPLDPVLSFENEELTVCFMEIDMDEMLEGVSMHSQNEGVTFCNIYTADGIALSNTVLGGLAVEDNLLEAMQHADYEKGYSYEKTAADFAEGRRGVVSFSYNGIQETLSYIPINGTDWLLTYLIRESVISEQISNISDGIVQRSLFQSLLTASILLLMFLFIIGQIRRNAKLVLDKETADAENRAKQQELEQRLALRDQLLEQEKVKAEQDSMITALSSDYRSVYYVSLDNNEAVCYRESKKFEEDPVLNQHFSYLEVFTKFAQDHVAESYRDGFLEFIQPENIRAGLAEQSVISYRYLEMKDGEGNYIILRIAGVRDIEDRTDHIVHAVCAGFANIDEEMRRTMEQQRILSDALNAAEQANRAKTAFLSNMSHEIRTPMNAIIGLDSLALKDENLSGETHDYLEKIGDSARHLLGLINDILDMSRIESGKLILRKEEFSFRGMLEQINTMVMSQCQEKGLTYECNVIGGVSDYYIGDNMKLKQVLINILSNAIKFTDAPGSVKLTVERSAIYEDNSTLRFVVKDTGIGIDPSFLPKIFDPFTQENSSTKNKYGSTGLGLAITKNIVELMNGTITVESEKGKGTAFTVMVTLKNSDHQGMKTSYIQPKDIRALVVDDEEIAAEHARIVLDEAGIRADTCYSGPQALQMLELAHTKNDPYNLVLLDWKMPGMDGLEVAREIRRRYDREATVIILTSFNWDEIMDEALHIGVDSFLSKPLFASNIIDEFEHIARKNQMNFFKEKRRSDLKGRHILLAEDIMINAEIMMQLIEMKEAEIDHAENGRIVLEMFEKSEPGYYDAILMDIRMPEMDGLEAAAAIRALDRPDAKQIPIIALTANAFDEDVQRSLQVGMNAHLSKPIEPEILFQTLEELIWDKENKG